MLLPRLLQSLFILGCLLLMLELWDHTRRPK